MTDFIRMRFRVLVIGIICLSRPDFALNGAEPSRPRPLHILADKWGQAELMRNICARYEFYYRMSYGLPPECLAECHTILIAGGRSIAKLDRERLLEFLKGGGNLILPGRNAHPYFTILPEVLGANAQLTTASAPGFTTQEHPLFDAEEEELEDLFLEDEAGEDATDKDKDGWSTTLFGTVLSKASGGQALVRWEEQVAVWVKDVGKGKVVFLADAIAPLTEIKSKVCVLPTYEEFLAKLFRFLGVPTLAEAASGYGRSVVWQRDPPLEGGRTLLPPYPASDGEVVGALKLRMGQNEHERMPFYTTVPFTPDDVQVTIEPFRGQGTTIPAEQVKIGFQGRLHKNYRGPLVYIRWLGNGETIAFGTAVTTWWLSVWTKNVPPGQYRGLVKIRLGKQGLAVPVEVSVDEAFIPTRKPFRYDAEFYYYKPPEGKVIEALEELGVDFFLGGLVSYGTMGPRVRATGESLIDFARKSPEPLRDQLPLTDFSGWLGRGDRLLQELIRHNITRFRTYGFFGCPPNGFLPLTRALYHDESLDADSLENNRVIIAVMREISRFFREKGYRHYYTKHMDEWGGDAIDAYLRVAIPLARAGWSNVANPNPRTPLANRVQRRRLWPYIHLYWMEDEPELWYDLMRLEPLLPGSEMRREYYTVITGSVWWYLGYLSGPKFAWAHAYRGYSGLHQHGWRRWTYESYNALYLEEKQQYCPSMGILMMAEGIEESQYGHVLRDMVAHLERDARTKGNAVELRRKWHEVVSESPDALLPVVKDRVVKPGATRADFVKAKTTTFALLAEASKAMKQIGVKPTLRWSDFVFVENGAPKATLLHSAQAKAAADALREQIMSETGVEMSARELPADPAAWSQLKNSVVLVNGVDAALNAKVGKHLDGTVNSRYPGEGTYVIHKDGLGNLWVVARDADTLHLGSMNLMRTSDLEPCWFRP